jgi:eukaryotic-like serine/threonine-protein kinase
VTKLLAKDPEDRYADAEELADDLWRVNRGLEPVAAGVGRKQGPGTQRTALASTNVTNKMQRPWPGPVPYRRKRRLPWLLIALAAILFTLGVLGSVQAVLGPDAMKGWFDVFQGDKQSPGQPAGQVKVPEVDGLTRSVAEKRLTGARLEVGKVTSFPSDSVAAGRVIEPGIVAGTPVEPGTDVNLTISSGPQPSSSASSSASAQSSAEPGASASASSSASAQPAPREDRQAAQTPAAGANEPRANVPRTKLQKSPPAQKQDAAAPASEPVDDSGGRGRGGEPGED